MNVTKVGTKSRKRCENDYILGRQSRGEGVYHINGGTTVNGIYVVEWICQHCLNDITGTPTETSNQETATKKFVPRGSGKNKRPNYTARRHLKCADCGYSFNTKKKFYHTPQPGETPEEVDQKLRKQAKEWNPALTCYTCRQKPE